MQRERNYVISIAGFDPSAGAGILSDIKTFEHLDVYGLGVCSAITFQTEDSFTGVQWVSVDDMLMQLQTLLEKYPVSFLKIGLIESMAVLEKVVVFISNNYPEIKVIWDPVLSASAGFIFHLEINEQQLFAIASHVFLITPNGSEAMKMMQAPDALQGARKMAAVTSVFLKSYQEDKNPGDLLLHGGEERKYPTAVQHDEKHGSGCVLSAAITAFLSRGIELPLACAMAKEYTLEFLKSSTGLLGYHSYNTKAFQHA